MDLSSATAIIIIHSPSSSIPMVRITIEAQWRRRENKRLSHPDISQENTRSAVDRHVADQSCNVECEILVLSSTIILCWPEWARPPAWVMCALMLPSRESTGTLVSSPSPKIKAHLRLCCLLPKESTPIMIFRKRWLAWPAFGRWFSFRRS